MSLARTGPAPSAAEDRFAIIDLLVRYATAMDRRDWSLLDQVFTDDLVYDAGEWIARSLTEYRGFVRPYLDGCGPTQHLLGNFRIVLDGDTATSAVYVRAFHFGTRELAQTVYEMFGEYRDLLVRTPAGWRSRERTLRVAAERGSRVVLRPA